MIHRKVTPKSVELLFAEEVLDYLNSFEGQVYGYKIEEQFNLCGSEVRRVVRTLRSMGRPIISSTDGYGVAKHKSELDGTILHIRGRRNSLTKVLNSLERCREELPE